jgi:hypothetical protein
VVNEVRIYAEGGGGGKDTKAAIRRGFGEFLRQLRALARDRRIRWNIIACGPRNAAFDAFKTALRTHAAAFNVLLVDAEGAVNQTPWGHLQERDGWNHQHVADDHCHLMVQMMEAWFVADIDTLESFYGNGFRRQAIPARNEVEAIDKAILETALQNATRDSCKGPYHKIRHGSKLLCLIDSQIVRSKASHCERLFGTLAHKIEAEEE